MIEIVTDLTTLFNKKTISSDKLSLLNSININIEDEQKLKLIPQLLIACGDKIFDVRTKSFEIIQNMISLCNPYLIKQLTETILSGFLDNDKTKLSALNLLLGIDDVSIFKEAIIQIVDPLSYIFADPSDELVSSAKKLFHKIINVVGNKDILPLAESLIEGLIDIKNLPKTIDTLTSTVFVQSVDASTLCIIMPLLTRALKNGTYIVKRQTIVIIENMTKLVEDEMSSLYFINNLLPLIKSAQDEIADPAVRLVADKVYKKLTQIKEKGLEMKSVMTAHLDHIKSILPNLSSFGCWEILDTMYHSKNMSIDNLKYYLTHDEDIANKIINEFNNTIKEDANENIIGAEELCNITFTLGYGSKILLHQTKLHMYRGLRYGLIGTN